MSYETPEHVLPIRQAVKEFIEEKVYPVEPLFEERGPHRDAGIHHAADQHDDVPRVVDLKRQRRRGVGADVQQMAWVGIVASDVIEHQLDLGEAQQLHDQLE